MVKRGRRVLWPRRCRADKVFTPMLPLVSRAELLVRRLLDWLPLSDYQKTMLWSTSLPVPYDRVKDWPYFRGIGLGLQGLASEYAVKFPDAKGYSLLEFGVAE